MPVVRSDVQVARPFIVSHVEQAQWQQHWQQQQRQYRINDGFQIVNGGGDGAICPSNNNWSAREYDSAVKRNFRFTEKDYDRALYTAAREGKPVVLVFGGKNVPDSQKLLNQSFPGGAMNDRAVTVYVDMDRVDRNSNIGRFVDRNVRNSNLAYTMVFSLSPDRRGMPTPDSPTMTAWGGRGEIGGLLQNQLGFAENNMRARRGGFNVPPEMVREQPRDRVERPENGERFDDTPQGRLAKARADIIKNYRDGCRATNVRDGEAAFTKAIKTADAVNPSDVRHERSRLTTELADFYRMDAQAQRKQYQKSLDIRRELLQIKVLEDMKWMTRASCGMNCHKWGDAEKGRQYIRDAGDIHPGIFDGSLLRRSAPFYGIKPEAIENIIQQGRRRHGMPPQRLDARVREGAAELPRSQDIPQRPPARPDQHPEQRPPVRPDERPTQRRPEVRTPDDVRPAKHEETEKLDLNRFQFHGEKELKAALETSRATGKPLVIKIGAEWCPPCKTLEKTLSTVEPKLKDDAIFIHLDMDKEKKLVFEMLGVKTPQDEDNVSVPVTLIAATITSQDGKPYTIVDARAGAVPENQLTGWIATGSSRASDLMVKAGLPPRAKRTRAR